jgi:hypothetical protein
MNDINGLPLRLSILRAKGFEECDSAYIEIARILSEFERGEAWELTVHPIEESSQFPRMHIDWHRGVGFVVMAFESEESIGFYPIVGAECGRPEVPIELGGQALERWPRELFVPWAVAAQALQTFLQTGRQDGSFIWVANNGFEREIIWENNAERIAWKKQERNNEE